MKKMNYMSLALLTLVGTTYGGMSYMNSMPNMGRNTQAEMAPSTSELTTAKMIANVMQSTKAESLTFPADFVGLLQQMSQLSMEKAKLKNVAMAYEEIRWVGSVRPNLTALMGNNTTFMQMLKTYDNYSEMLMNDQMTVDMDMQTIATPADEQRVEALFGDAIKKQIYLHQMLTTLDNDFLKAQPEFAKLHQQKQQTMEQLMHWIGAFVEAFTGQPLSPIKKTQIATALKHATQPAEVVAHEEHHATMKTK